MSFGSSEAWLRGLSVIFALGSIFFVYQLGSHIFNRSVGLLAAMLMTLSPLFINHAQEVRMYGISTFLCLGGTLALSFALDKARVVWVVSWLVLRILAVLSTPLNVLMFLPDGIIWAWKLRKVILRHRQKFIFGGTVAILIVGILSWGWISSQGEATSAYVNDWVSDQPKPGLTSVIGRLTSFTARWPLRTVSSPLSHFYKLYDYH